MPEERMEVSVVVVVLVGLGQAGRETVAETPAVRVSVVSCAFTATTRARRRALNNAIVN